MSWNDWNYHELRPTGRGHAIAGYRSSLPPDHLRLLINDDQEAISEESIRAYCQQYLSVPDSPDGCPTDFKVEVFYTADFELARKLFLPDLAVHYMFDGICQDLIDDNSGHYAGNDNLSLIKQGMLSPQPALMAVTNDARAAQALRDHRGSSIQFAISKEPEPATRAPAESAEIRNFFRRAEHTRSLFDNRLLREYRYIIGPRILDEIDAFMKLVDRPLRSGGGGVYKRMPIVILGETGTGKEAIARLIHLQDRGSEDEGFHRFQPVLIAGIPPGVLEGELFGVENLAQGKLRKEDRILGYLRMAEHGTYFQDELEDLPKSIQAKLLRFLEQQQIRPVGSDHWVTLEDVRCVFASNKDLRNASTDVFREDFLHRIDGLVLELPPLKDRVDDHEALIHFFLGKYQAAEHCQSSQPLTDEALDQLLAQCASGAIRGNIRGLSNLIRRMVIVTPEGRKIDHTSLELARRYSLFSQ